MFRMEIADEVSETANFGASFTVETDLVDAVVNELVDHGCGGCSAFRGWDALSGEFYDIRNGLRLVVKPEERFREDS